MPQGNPKSGERYLHFKQKLYQVITTAEHSETGERLVIYQALYGEFQIYARPLSMFISEVDREKYPQAGQRYRFMLVEGQEEPSAAELRSASNRESWEEPSAADHKAALNRESWEESSAADRKSALNREGGAELSAGNELDSRSDCERQKEHRDRIVRRPSEGRALRKAAAEAAGQPSRSGKRIEGKDITALLMDFYDAESFDEKYDILTAMQNGITDIMIDNIAVVLDVVIPEGDLYVRYEELRRCLRTRQRYELVRP